MKGRRFYRIIRLPWSRQESMTDDLDVALTNFEREDPLGAPYDVVASSQDEDGLTIIVASQRAQ